MELINKTDYLLRQLVRSLEQKTGKEDVLSPYNKWLGKEMEQDKAENEQFDKELKGIVEKGR